MSIEISTNELRKIRHELRKTSYAVAGLNTKIEREPNRSDLKSMRAKLLLELQQLELTRSRISAQIKASPYALTDVVEVIDALANIQSQIAHGGSEEGQMAISAFIRYLTKDKERLTAIAEGGEVSSPAASAEAHHYSEWRRMANLRQGVINKLDKKIARLELENAQLRAALAEIAA